MNDEASSERRARVPWPVTLALALALCSAVAAVFSPALEAGFLQWDDRATLLDVQEYRGLGPESLAWMFRTAHMGPYQPLAWLSFAIDHALYGLDARPAPPQARGFHLTNIVLHALGALVFWRLAVTLLRRVGALQSTPALAVEIAAAFGAAVYAVHPLRVESVAWVTERRDVLCALFYSLAALAHVRSTRAGPIQGAASGSRRVLGLGVLCAAAALASFELSIDWDTPGMLALSRHGAVGLGCALSALLASTVLVGRALRTDPGERRWFGLASFAFALALLAKGLAMVLPAVLLVVDVWPLRRARDRSAATLLLAEKAPLFALAGMAARLAMWGQRSLPEAVLTWEAHTLSERLLQACYGLCFYPLKTLAPFGLSPLYQLPDTLRLEEARFALAVAGASLLALTAFIFARRAPWWSASLAAFATAIAPVLGFSQAGPQLVADRYSILACMPFALLAGGGLLRAWCAAVTTRRVSQAMAVVVFVGLCALGSQQAARWKDDETLWRYANSVRPADALIWGQLASVESDLGLKSSDPSARRAHFERAAAYFERELQLDPTPLASDLLNYGSTLLRLERPAQAEIWLRRAVQVRPRHSLSRANLGASLAAQGRNREAAEELRRAVELDPSYARGWHQLGAVLAVLGDRAGAVAALERCIELWPSFEPAHRMLAELNGGR